MAVRTRGYIISVPHLICFYYLFRKAEYIIHIVTSIFTCFYETVVVPDTF